MNRYLLLATGFALTLSATAQQGRTLTDKDYERAEKFMAYNTESFIDKSNLRPNWLAGDRFWYSIASAQGTEFILVDPAKKGKSPAFDHQKMATALSSAAGTSYQANKLPITAINYA
ncbi:MAG TPA: hypothetical protein VL088_03280, partial [Pedobacter sp.]|nr:hypothetical protein [Pedobacter sp.]